ncbi:MAG: hypothetical protein HY554_04980 [Elusimicrobia bacterium]|nr:hypothetical protein [Elusimicrobiota bacterium]
MPMPAIGLAARLALAAALGLAEARASERGLEPQAWSNGVLFDGSRPAGEAPSAGAAPRAGESAPAAGQAPVPERRVGVPEPPAASAEPDGEAYRRLAAADKRDALWRRILATRYAALPPLSGNGGSALERLRGLAGLLDLRRLRLSFDRSGDVRPPELKRLHPFGAVARVDWEPVEGQPYTGVFRSGALGLVRLSLGADPKSAFIPGLAVKLFLDGRPSVDALAIHSLDGESSRDFFGPTLSNVVAPPRSLAIRLFVAALSLVAEPLRLPVEALARHDGAGRPQEPSRAPYALEFRPGDAAARAAKGEGDFRESLAALPAGTVLYDVYARRGKADSESSLIARLRTGSAFVASDFGDRELFFRHPRK